MESDQKTFAFQIWNGGMINQLMGVQFASATCAYFDREGVMIEGCELSNQSSYIGDRTSVPLSQLIETSNSISFVKNKNFDVSEFFKVGTPSKFYIGPSNIFFANKRRRFFLQDKAKTYFDNTLCNYSIMFSERPVNVDVAIGEVRFKNEYQDFANHVSCSIGNFNGTHLRFTDFAQQILRLDINDIRVALEQLGSEQIVVCTDDPSILEGKQWAQKLINVAQLIKTDFLKDFTSLSIANEITLGLVSLLIMGKSSQFIGTPMSTYSNQIHRSINQRKNGLHDWKNIGVKNRPKTGIYSWDSYKDTPMSTKIWSMDWPESLLMV